MRWLERIRQALGMEREAMEKETYLVVGLGNYGDQYAHTRHNAGFEVTDILSRRWSAPLQKRRCAGLLAEVNMDGRRVVLVQPQTYMNSSGQCVAELLQWYKCPLDHLMVIYDDIDLPLGRLRVRKTGSAGTHNGMRSIIAVTPTHDFPRVRVGVGGCPPERALVDWVLSRYQRGEEQETMAAAFSRAADCVEDWLKNGMDHAMQAYNQK